MTTFLERSSNRVVASVTAAFAPRIGFQGHLTRVAEELQPLSKMPHWQTNGQYLMLRDPDRKRAFIADHRQAFVQVLTFSEWKKQEENSLELIEMLLDEYDIEELQRVSVAIKAFLDVGMTKPEIVDLTFGSFLQPMNQLEKLCGHPNDSSFSIWGERDDFQVSLTVLPQDEEEVRKDFKNIPYLNAYVEPQLLDGRLENHLKAIAHDCLHLEITVEKSPLSRPLFRRTVGNALKVGNSIAAEAVNTLRALPGEES